MHLTREHGGKWAIVPTIMHADLKGLIFIEGKPHIKRDCVKFIEPMIQRGYSEADQREDMLAAFYVVIVETINMIHKANQAKSVNKATLLPPIEEDLSKVVNISKNTTCDNPQSNEQSFNIRHRPREHHRRGFYKNVRTKKGLKQVFIQATIVNRGIGGGKIDHNYVVKGD